MQGTFEVVPCRKTMRDALRVLLLLVLVSGVTDARVSEGPERAMATEHQVLVTHAERSMRPPTPSLRTHDGNVGVQPDSRGDERREQRSEAHEPRESRGAEGRAIRVLEQRVSRPAMIRVAQAIVVGGIEPRRIRQILQRSLRPRVRDCFAQARAGNPEWSGRAVLVLTIEGPAVVFAEVQTESEAVRQCILEGIEFLVMPELGEGQESERTRVYYPFVSPGYRRFPSPPLESATVQLLDAVFHEEADASPLTLLSPSAATP